MSEQKCRRILLAAGTAAVFLWGVWLALRVLLPWTLPLWIALGLSALIERPVLFLTAHLHWPRWAASAVCTVVPAFAIGACALLAGWRLWCEALLLVEKLPGLLSSLTGLGARLDAWSYRLLIAVPPSVRDYLGEAMAQIADQSASWPAALGAWLAQAGVLAASALPAAAFFLFTTFLATYLSSSIFPQLTVFFQRQFPASSHPRVFSALRRFRSSFCGWFRAQLLLLLVTFGELTAGFLFLRMEPALLPALLVSLLDALPVFGTGTVLIPWGAAALLTGRFSLGAGLLLLCLLVSVVRSLLEPRLVGAHSGLPPLAVLSAIYIGFQAFGVIGMVLSPLALILLKEAHSCGLLRIWKD